jgi:hypothetical protein
MLNSAKRAMAVLISVAMATSGCATTASARLAPVTAPPEGTASRAVLVEYVQKLPPGTLVRIDRAKGRSLRGTLMKATDRSLFLQPKTRISEGVVEIAMANVIGVTPVPQGGSNLGRAIGAGAAAGAGATLAIFLILIAAFND